MGYNKRFDLLTIVHFNTFFILGCFCKNQYLFAFTLGILWEIVEYSITQNPWTRNLLIKYWVVPQHIWDEDLFNKNRFYDLAVNMLGYYVSNQF